MRFFLEEAREFPSEEDMAAEVFQVSKSRFSKWMNGHSLPERRNLVTAANYIHKHGGMKRELAEFRTDFLKSFGYLSRLNVDAVRPGETAPPLAEMYLDYMGYTRKLPDPTGAPHLSMPKPSGHKFHYTNTNTRILGRDGPREALRRFLEDVEGFKWWQLSGSGGQGKSSLALDLVLQAQKTMPQWRSGFLDGPDSIKEFARSVEQWKPSQPHLIIIDYVTSRLEDVRNILQSCVDHSKSATTAIRVLLLERQPWDLSGRSGMFELQSRAHWYEKITWRQDGNDPDLERHIYNDKDFGTVLHLEALNANDLLEITKRVCAEGSNPANLPEPDIRAMQEATNPEGRPLYAYFLGKALGESELKASGEATALLDWVLATDRQRRWSSHFDELPPNLGDDPKSTTSGGNPAVRLALLATILGQTSAAIIEGKEKWQAANTKVRRQALTLCDQPIPQGPAPTHISGLRPDALGEWFVLRSIEFGMDQQWLMDLAWKVGPKETTSFLRKLAEDFAAHSATKHLINAVPRDPIARDAYLANTKLLIEPYILHGSAKENVPELLPLATAIGNAPDPTRYMKSLYRSLDGDMSPRQRMKIENDISVSLMDLINEDPQKYPDAAILAVAKSIFNDGTKNRKDRVIPLLDELISRGNPEAMCARACMYYFGFFGKPNFVEAHRLFQRSAGLGFAESMNGVGVCTMLGRCCERSPIRALEQFESASEAGSAFADFNLMMCYLFTPEIEVNFSKAEAGLLRASRKGVPAARIFHSIFLHKGFILERDVAQAKSIIDRLAREPTTGTLGAITIRSSFAIISLLPKAALGRPGRRSSMFALPGGVFAT